MAVASTSSTPPYTDAVEARQARFRPSRRSLSRTANYTIDPQFSVPHGGTHIHAFAAPPCSSHLYTGGSDGFVRRYALHPTLNGSGVDNPLVPNLTSKPGGHERPPGTDTRQPVLSAYWENEDPGDWIDDVLLPAPPAPQQAVEAQSGEEGNDDRQARIRWGPKPTAYSLQSAVYSLAVQREELWGLSGTAKGSINLWTVRHDEGQVRHVFRPTAAEAAPTQGHSPKAAVSVLALDRDERSFLSGGWDGRILQWDLDTGAVTRPFFAHSSQVSSIAYRPLHPPTPLDSTPRTSGDVDMADDDGEWIDAPGRVRIDEAALAGGEAGGEAESKAESKVDSAADGGANGRDEDATGSDADADGEIDETLAPASTSPHSILPPKKPETARDDVPLVGAGADAGEMSRDVFVSTALDGQVLLWDRRVGEGAAPGLVHRFDDYRGKGEGKKRDGWSTSACWSPSGSHLYVARRAPSIQVYDLRYSAPLSTLALPTSTGPVSAVAAMPNGRHLLSASWDCVRLWDVEKAMEAANDGAASDAKKKSRTMPVGATVVPGHYGGTVSSLYIDPTCRWLTTTSGHRGWDGTTTENLVIYEIRTRSG